MTFSTDKLRSSTKSLLGVLVSAGTLFQVPQVHDALISFGHAHPHWTGVIGTLIGIAGLLHNPEVRDALGIKSTLKVEQVALSTNASQK